MLLPDPMPVAPDRGPARRRRVAARLEEHHQPGAGVRGAGRRAPAPSPTPSTPTTPRRWSTGLRALGRRGRRRLGSRAPRRSRARPAGRSATWRSSTPGCRGPRARFLLPGRRPGRGAPARRRRQPDARAPDGRGHRRRARARRRGPRGRRARATSRSRSIGGTLAGGEVAVRGDVSSQFLSGPAARRPGHAHRAASPGSSATSCREPYVDMTVAVMASFGVEVERPDRAHLGGRRRRPTAPPTSPSSPTPAPRPTCSRRRPCSAVAATVDGLGDGVAAGRPRVRRRARADGRHRRARRRPHDGHRHRRAARRRGRHEPALRHRPDPRRGGRLRRRPDAGHRHRLHPRQGDRPRRERGRRAAPARASTPRRSPTASPSARGPLRAATVADLRRPPHGDGLRARRPAVRRRADRRPGVRGQDVPRASGASSTSCEPRRRRALWSARP